MAAAATKKRLLEEALTLPSELRANLAAALLASLEQSPEQGSAMDAAWMTEIERRAERARGGGSQGEPWEAVRRRLVSRLERA